MPGLYDQFQNVTAQSLDSAANFNTSLSQSRLIDAKAAQQQAETQDYIMQSRKEMRDAQVAAETAKANADTQMSKFITDNPVMYNHMMASGVHQKISESLSKASEDDINYQGNTMKDITVDNYADKYTELSRNAPQIAVAWPTPQEVATDPTKLAKAQYMAGVVSMTRTDRVAQQAAAAKTQAELTKEAMQNQTSLKTTAMQNQTSLGISANTQAQENERARLGRENQKDIWGQRTAAQIQVGAGHDAARVQSANIRTANQLKGTVAKQTEFGSAQVQMSMAATGIQQMLELNSVAPPKGDMQALVTNSFSAAQSKYEDLKKQYEDDVKSGRPALAPPAPAEIAVDIAKQIIANPDLTKKGSNFPFMHGSVKSDEAAQYNKRQKAMMASEKFKALSPAEQKLVLDQAAD